MSSSVKQLMTMTNRDVHWIMVAVGSTVALVSLVTDYDGKLSDQTKEYKWAASAISISFSLAWIAVVANMLMRTQFFGTLIEGGTSILVCAFWAAVMPTLWAPDNEVSVTTTPAGGIRNANLYFFTWFSFVMSFMTLVHFVNARFGTGVRYVFSSWGLLTMTSIVVAVSAGRLHDFLTCEDEPWNMGISFGTMYQEGDVWPDLEKVCARTAFAISIGAICGFVSAMWMLMDLYWSNSLKEPMEIGLGLLLFTLWIFGVGFITFGDNGPAQNVGNLYFFTWGSFGASLLVLLQAVQGYNDSQMAAEPAVTENDGRTAGDEKKSSPVDNVVDDGEASA